MGSVPPLLSRRRLLGGTLGAIGLTTVAGGAALVALRGGAPDVAGLRCLTAHEYRTVASLAEALFPQGGAFPQGANDFDLPRLFDGFLADEDETRQGELKKALLLVEYGPVVYDHRATTFSQLDAEERLAHFVRWQESSDGLRRKIATALRRLLSLVFYDHKEVWPAIGYSMLPRGPE